MREEPILTITAERKAWLLWRLELFDYAEGDPRRIRTIWLVGTQSRIDRRTDEIIISALRDYLASQRAILTELKRENGEN